MHFRAAIFVLSLAASTAAYAETPELTRLAAQDQADRSEKEGGWGDDARRRRVLELLAAGAVASPQDELNAALILQHTPGIGCEGRLKSLSPENFLLAHHLAKAEFSAGLDKAKYLVAATIDRYLSFSEGRKLYCTNKLVDLEAGEVYLPQIDRSISDEERAKLGVPPLASVLKQAPERKLVGGSQEAR